MRTALIFVTSMVIIMCSVESIQAGQQQSFGDAPTFASAPAAGRDNLPHPGASPSAATLHRPPASYRPHSSLSDIPADENDFPRYPYPPHPNPYYEGAANRNVLSEGMDWLWGASTSMADRVTHFVDTRFFPVKPATDGGGASQLPAPGPTPTVRPTAPTGPMPMPMPGMSFGPGDSPVAPNTFPSGR